MGCSLLLADCPAMAGLFVVGSRKVFKRGKKGKKIQSPHAA